jgi:hypothetical protein
MRNEDFLDQEDDYYREQAYLNAEAEFEEWKWVQEQIKFDAERKPARIFVKREEQITIENDKTTIDF